MKVTGMYRDLPRFAPNVSNDWNDQCLGGLWSNLPCRKAGFIAWLHMSVFVPNHISYLEISYVSTELMMSSSDECLDLNFCLVLLSCSV